MKTSLIQTLIENCPDETNQNIPDPIYNTFLSISQCAIRKIF